MPDQSTTSPQTRPKSAAWEGLRMAILCMLVSVLGLWIVYHFAERALIQSLRGHLEDLATITADQVDAETHTTLAEPDLLGSPSYEKTSAPLLRLRKAVPDVFYAYTLIWRDGQPVFVLDSSYYIKNQGDLTEIANPGEVYDDAPEALSNSLKSGKTTSCDEPYTDKWGIFLSAFAPIRDSQGNLSGIVGIDISMNSLATRLKPVRLALGFAALACFLGSTVIGLLRYRSHASLMRHEAQLVIARADAERGAQSKSVFLAVMSHEIRTPLNGVLGMAEALSQTPLTDEQQEHVRAIRSSGNLLLVMLNDILDFSKIDANSLTVDLEPTPLLDLVKDIAKLHRASAENKGLTLTVESASTAPLYLLVDATRTSQIIGNLLSNAIKFTEKGSICIKIDSANASETMARISIEDSGIGIPENLRQNLFMPFSQLDTALNRRVGGTGLGLAISRRLTELMGGTLNVESQEGQGSCFILMLPATAQEPAATPHQESATDAPSSYPFSVLVAEDVAVNRKVAELMLKQYGIDASFAEDGIDAIRQWRELQPDVILMDIQMPNLDGREATRQIREACGNASQPWIIALTGGVTEEDQEQAYKAGINDFISKPITHAALAAALSRVPLIHKD